MADFNSSLPVRTENPGDVVAKIADATTPTQQLAVDASGKITVKLDDATGNGITSETNGPNQALHTADQANGPVAPGTAANFSELAGGQYTSATGLSGTPLTAGQQAALQVDADGRLLVTASNFPTTLDTNYGAVGANTLRTASEIGNATGAADFNVGATGAQTLRTQANQGAPTTATNGWPVKPTDGTNSQSYTAAGEAKVQVTELLTEDHNYGTVGTSTLRTAAQIGNATGAADFNNGATGAQTLRTAANLAVLGANVTATNPVPVTIVTATSGTSIHDYKDASSIAAAASDNHDYTVTAGKTLTLSQVVAAASGKAKMLITVETGVATGVFNTYFAQFNSTAETNMQVLLADPIAVAAGVRVRVVMTNLDKAAQDLYSTICGSEN